MKQRLRTGALIVLATVLAIFSKLLPLGIGEYIFDVFILMVILIASCEMSNIMEKMNKPTNKLMTFIYPIIYYIVLMICTSNGVIFPLITLIEIAVLLIYSFIVWIAETTIYKGGSIKNTLSTVLNTMVACVYPTFVFGLFLNINHIDIYGGKYLSLILIIFVVAVTMLTDTFAYLVGSKVRGPKLAPSISPNKTISGAVGGLVGGVAGAMLLYWISTAIPALNSVLVMHGIAWWQFLLLGLVASVFGQAGDLFESKLKRYSNIKDSSNIFPGHGGMLDRIDAMIFVVVFVFLYATLLIL